MMDDKAIGKTLAEMEVAVRRAIEKVLADRKATHDELEQLIKEQFIQEMASIEAGCATALAEFSTILSRGDNVGVMVAAREARERHGALPRLLMP